MALPESVKNRYAVACELSDQLKILADQEPDRKVSQSDWDIWMDSYNDLRDKKDQAWRSVTEYVSNGS